MDQTLRTPALIQVNAMHGGNGFFLAAPVTAALRLGHRERLDRLLIHMTECYTWLKSGRPWPMKTLTTETMQTLTTEEMKQISGGSTGSQGFGPGFITRLILCALFTDFGADSPRKQTPL